MKRRVVIPLPDRDFDTTEVSIPWKVLKGQGHDVIFATETGAKPACDPLLLTGVILGQLGAAEDAKRAYAELRDDGNFNAPIRWDAIAPKDFDGLILPGGHAPGMRQYLGSGLLQDRCAAFFSTGKPVGAICHGVLVLARARDSSTGQSVLHRRKTTCLPGYMEGLAYGLTSWKLGRYYRTYPAYVEDEVKAALEHPQSQFVRGPVTLGTRGTETDDRAAFTVVDGHYLSARWPGDAWKFGREFARMIAR